MASEYTPNYNLDLYASEDKPNLRDQYNAAMGKIDTQLKANADGVTNVSASVVAATTAASEAKQIAQDAKATAENAAPINHASDTSTYGLGTSVVYGHVAVRGSIGTPTIQEDGVAASPKAVYDYAAPKNHASSNSTYGIGGNTLYGHVKLVDSATATGTSAAGGAATPSCVDDKINNALNGQDVAYFHRYLADQVTINYSGSKGTVSGTGTLSVEICPAIKLCSIYWWNNNLSISSSSSGEIILFTLPSGYKPKHDQGVVVYYSASKSQNINMNVRPSTGQIHVDYTGSSNTYSLGGNIEATLTFFYE